ncbi:XRE family transcriptional regulator [Paenibacillus sp. GbtcB18]|uniref:helix-turn-helix domain-containing protein n=1 Tax=Paenibacillus sp. GbtcB18 TaxID=2824763 RepID=UPI0028160C30|nr:XRE family transcriptional regulator [Paenibacillus sp. GbtcB18]
MISVHPIHVIVGHNLERIRKKKGLSLDKVSELTGVSKGMLYQIERGDSQPTITTVWKIATGLHVSFSSLIAEEDLAVSVVSPSASPVLSEDDGKCRVYVLFPFDAQTRFETFTIVLDAGGGYFSSPHNEGVHEYITVVSGSFTLQLGDESYTLSQGKAIRFSGHVPHRYKNHSGQETVLHVMMYYADL